MISPDGDSAPQARSWRNHKRFAVAFIALWLIVQLAIPLSRIGSEEPPERFVWRMFSTSEPAPEYIVFTSDTSVAVDLNEVTARLRADLPFNRFLPEHLCRQINDAVRVSWDDGDHQCVTP